MLEFFHKNNLKISEFAIIVIAHSQEILNQCDKILIVKDNKINFQK